MIIGGREYIDRSMSAGVAIPIGTVPPVGGVALRRQNVARIRVGDDGGAWRVILAPLIFQEQVPGDILDLSSGVPRKPLALVSFGTAGVMNREVEVDWPANGGSFTVWGDSVDVDVQIPSTWISGFGNAQIIASATIVPCESPSGTRPTRTIYTGLVPGALAFSQAIPVPRFARSFRWYQVINLSAANVNQPITWYACLDAGLAVATMANPDATYSVVPTPPNWAPDGIQLAPDARFLTFQNRAPGAGDSLGLAVQFSLDLG